MPPPPPPSPPAKGVLALLSTQHAPQSAGQQLVDELEKAIFGKRAALTQVCAALLAGGHVLLEDVPGTGKTTLARALARSLGVSFRRIQFTPDLLPSDLTGVSIFNRKTQDFEFRPGPLFAHIVVADELNRATPRTQSALLEAMEERTVTVDGTTHPLPSPFFVVATQNPVEQHGVYDLPEAQLDRFLIRARLGYASGAEERRMVEAQRTSSPLEDVRAVLDPGRLRRIMVDVRDVTVEPNVIDYMVRLVGETREHPEVALGASARASLGLHRLCQSWAWVTGKSFVTPEMVKKLSPAVLCHRLMLKPQARLGGVTADHVVAELLDKVEVPVIRMQGFGSGNAPGP